MGSSVSSSIFETFFTKLVFDPPTLAGTFLTSGLSYDFSSSPSPFLSSGFFNFVAAVATIDTLPIVGFSPAGLAIT